VEDKEREYDVALSFAGEEREYVRDVAICLRNSGVKVFFDEFETTKMWGENLVEFLHHVFENGCRYCVMFISKHYAEKFYPTIEKRSTLSDTVKVLHGGILPIRFDKTDIPGLPSATMYLSRKDYTPIELCQIVIEKIGHNEDPIEWYYTGRAERLALRGPGNARGDFVTCRRILLISLKVLYHYLGQEMMRVDLIDNGKPTRTVMKLIRKELENLTHWLKRCPDIETQNLVNDLILAGESIFENSKSGVKLRRRVRHQMLHFDTGILTRKH